MLMNLASIIVISNIRFGLDWDKISKNISANTCKHAKREQLDKRDVTLTVHGSCFITKVSSEPKSILV